MASIQSLGAGSGLLTNELVDNIVKAERDATDKRLLAKRTEIEAKVSALGSVRSAADLLQAAARSVSQPLLYATRSASSSKSDVLTATASSTAALGTHSVRVNALAAAHALASKRFTSINDPVGTGTLTFRYGTTTFSGLGAYTGFVADTERTAETITIDDSNDTLTGLRDAINAADFGVNASIVNDGGGFRLVLAGEETGRGNSLQIVASEGTEPGLSAFAFNLGNTTPDVNMMQTLAAADAEIVINGLTLTRSTNVVTDIIDGVSLNLNRADTTGNVQVTVAADHKNAVAALQNYVERFNNLKTLTDGLTAFNPETEEKGLLLGDATVRTLLRQIRGVTNAAISGLPSARNTLVEVGVRTGEDGKLLLNTDTLNAALRDDALSVAALFASTGRASDSRIAVGGIGNAPAGSYAVEVLRHASSARLNGGAVPGLAGPITINADNDALSVRIDGRTSGEILLTHGTYADGTALAVELEARINADSELRDTGTRVSVDYDELTMRLRIDSVRVGAASTVSILAVDTTTQATLGLAESGGVQNVGLNTLGRVDGIVATGNGNALRVPAGQLSARSGFFAGTRNDVSFPFVVDAASDGLTVTVDGVTSGAIALTHGSYADGAALAAELMARINADSTLAGANRAVSVSYDIDTRAYTIISNTTGNSSRVDVASIDAGAATLLGLAAGTGVAGHAASTRDVRAAGMTVAVDGGALGARGTLTVIRGVMDRLVGVLGDALAGDGVLQARIGGLDTSLAEISAESTRLNARITAFEARLRTQFATADALISQLNSTSTFLTQQLQFLPDLYKRGD